MFEDSELKSENKIIVINNHQQATPTFANHYHTEVNSLRCGLKQFHPVW